jgi:hypothetical protein
VVTPARRRSAKARAEIVAMDSGVSDRREAVHRLAPGPEGPGLGGRALGVAAQRELKRVGVGGDEAGDVESVAVEAVEGVHPGCGIGA